MILCSFGGILAFQDSALRPAEASHEIIDSLKRRVAVPDRVGRILSLEPEITRIIAALGAGDKLVGVDYFMHLYDHTFKIIFPKGPSLPSLANTAAMTNIEMAMRLKPDVVFSPPEDYDVPDSLQEKMNTPVVALSSLGKFQNLLEEIELVGDIIGAQERAHELVRYFKGRLEDIRKTVASFPQERRPRVYLSFWSSLIKTPSSYEPVDAAGGRNLAEGLFPAFLGSSGPTINLEKLISWDPDIILVQGNFLPKDRIVTVAGVLRDPRLSSLRAVKNKRVFYTFGYWSWWDPAEVLLETLYLARLFYPDRFPSFDLEKEGNEIFQEFYGIDKVFTELSRALGCDEWLKE